MKSVIKLCTCLSHYPDSYSGRHQAS